MKVLLLSLIGLLIGCSVIAIVPRGFVDRVYEFDEYPMVQFKYCSKYLFLMPQKPKFCREWKYDKIDISTKEGYSKFKDATFVLAHERLIFMQ